MALVYRNINDIELNSAEDVKTTSLNNIFNKLLDNDKSMLIQNLISPSIWECKWYSDQTIEGYQTGEAVWINTESLDNLVKAKEQDIIDYGSTKDARLAKKFEELSGSGYTSERLKLCKDIVMNNYNSSYGYLYYIGDITQPVQIKISLVDNNKSYPTNENSEKWADFFIKQSENDERIKILSTYSDTLNSYFKQHEIEYHLSGSTYIPSELETTFLKKDLSNAKDFQLFNSHYWYKPAMYGYDNVALMHIKTHPSVKALTKWFRQWNSGYLEHGGIIDIGDRFAEDRTIDDNSIIIKLNWSYNGLTAPTYDYPLEGLQSFYSEIKYNDGGDLDQMMRYSIQITPICSDSDDDNAYSELTNVVHKCYEITDINNTSFKINFANSNIHRFSYIIKGFSLKGRYGG